ncbi:IS1380 family transposase, partial [Mycobacterium simiae]
MQAATDWSKSLRVEVRGDDVVGHAGNVISRMLADATGLTSGLSVALSRPEVFHDRGAVMRDVSVSIAGGAQN